MSLTRIFRIKKLTELLKILLSKLRVQFKILLLHHPQPPYTRYKHTAKSQWGQYFPAQVHQLINT